MNYEVLGRHIKLARVAKDYTQEKLAQLIGCSTVFISEIEKGKKRPSLETLHRISVELGVGIDELFYGKACPIESSQMNCINTILSNRSVEELATIRQLLELLYPGTTYPNLSTEV